MKLLVCGGRGYSDKATAWGFLDVLHAGDPIEILVHGACPVRHGGADMIADAWAWTNDVDTYAVPINQWLDGPWPGCGPARNVRMLAKCLHWIDCAMALPGGNGTAHMVGLMRAAGIEVWEPLNQ